MKFRNKETGKIRDFEFVVITKDMDAEFAKYAHNAPVLICRSIDRLNEEWEDYKPPLIKDEKVRKAVRAWAEANEITQVSYDAGWNAFRCTDFVVDFDYDFDRHDGLKDTESYTIAELCGEEEE